MRVHGSAIIHVLFTFSLLFLGVLPANSQKDTIPAFRALEWDLISNDRVLIDASYSVNSTGMTGRMYQRFLFGGHIPSSTKKEALQQMEKVNRLGGDRIFSVGGSFSTDTLFGRSMEGTEFFTILKEYSHYRSVFTRDLYRTVFFGNAGSEGNTLDLAPFRLQTSNFQQFKIGMMDSRGRFDLGIALGFVNGKSNTTINVDEAHLFTSEQGRELRLRSKGRLMLSDTASGSAFFRNQGMGVSIDLMAAYDLKKLGNIRFALRDMGIMTWSSSPSQYRTDTTHEFRGVEVRNLLAAQGTSTEGNFEDSLRSRFFPEPNDSAYQTFLPAMLTLTHEKELQTGFWLRTLFQHRPYSDYKPYFGLEGILEKGIVDLGVNAGYGGYGEFAFGLSAGVEWSDNSYFFIRVPHLEGLVLPSTMGGIGGRAGIHYIY